MLGYTRNLLKVVTSAALAWACAVTCAGQPSAVESRNNLLEQMSLTTDDLSSLERGGMVVKLLPVTDKREVAFCGVLRLQSTPATLLTAFKESLTQQNGRVIMGGGRINPPLAPEDLQSLTLEKRDVEDMKQCVAGNCRLKMSAEMIERMQREVDWGAPDYRTPANRLFRQMLLDYVRDYLARGDAALIEYNDRAIAMRLGEEQRSLLTSLPYVNDSAPEFVGYLQNFPRRELPGVENALHWAKIKFGLKPVIVITHTATYTRLHDNAPQILVATKQLYANHYFDSSLSLTLLMNVAAGDGDSDTYLLYANRSRVDTLRGLFGDIKRRVIEKEALDGLRAILQQTKLNMETGRVNQPGSPPRADNEAAGLRLWAQWLSERMQYLF